MPKKEDKKVAMLKIVPEKLGATSTKFACTPGMAADWIPKKQEISRMEIPLLSVEARRTRKTAEPMRAERRTLVLRFPPLTVRQVIFYILFSFPTDNVTSNLASI